MLRWTLFLVLFSLSGCSSLQGVFENRLSCTLDKKEALFTSKYGWLGITAELSPKDAASACAQEVIIISPTPAAPRRESL